MLTIKNINGSVMYNYHEKKAYPTDDKSDKMITKFGNSKLNRWVKHNQAIVDYIVDKYVEAARSFHDDNNRYYILFDSKIKQDILEWIFQSSQ